MSKPAYLYVTAISVAALVLIAVLPWADVYTLAPSDLFGLITFVALGVLSETMAVDFALGPIRTAKSSISFLPLLACAILFPQPAAILAALLIHGFTELVVAERVLWRAAFNISQVVLAIALATSVYGVLGGTTSPSFEVPFIAFAGLAVGYFATNILLVSTFFAIRQKLPLSAVLAQAIGPGGGNLFYDLLASPVAIFAAILYREFGFAGLVLMILPLLLIRYSYLSKLQLQRANRDLLRVLIKTIETRDPYTSGHSVRVSTLARAIAQDVGLRGRQVEQVETAALLHDIGKIDSVYATLIRKPFDLTDDERQVIRTHAVKGAELLKNLTSLDDAVIKGVRHHHERFDGSGYPDALTGSSIPVAARIIMISDAVDAMLSDRPYRPALSIERTRNELLRFAGSQFDPVIIQTLLRRNSLERAAALVGRSAMEGPIALAQPA